MGGGNSKPAPTPDISPPPPVATTATPCDIKCPGGGGDCKNTNDQVYNSIGSQMSVSAGVSAGPLSAASQASASNLAVNTGNNPQNTSTCPVNINQKQTTTNISKSLMSVDNSVMIMNNSSLSSTSSAVNQMTVNSITTTSSSSTQNATVTQAMVINISGVGGDVNITGVSMKNEIIATNSIQMDLSAIDEVRTDLANQVLQQFGSMSNTDAMDTMNSAISKDLSASNDAGNKIKAQAQIDQKQTAQVPAAPPHQITPPQTGANVTTEQTQVNNSTASTILSSPYTSSNNIHRSIQSSILNAVTQNFTHETVTQLVTAINVSQSMGINIKNVKGNVNLKDISMTNSIVMNSTLTQHMDIGTAITNSVAASLGASTDDQQVLKKSTSSTLADVSTARGSAVSTTDTESAFQYKQELTQSMIPSSGSSGGSGSCSVSSVILCIIFMVGPMLLSKLPTSLASADSDDSSQSDSSQSDSSQSSSTATTPTTTTEPGKTSGGYYFY